MTLRARLGRVPALAVVLIALATDEDPGARATAAAALATELGEGPERRNVLAAVERAAREEAEEVIERAALQQLRPDPLIDARQLDVDHEDEQRERADDEADDEKNETEDDHGRGPSLASGHCPPACLPA